MGGGLSIRYYLVVVKYLNKTYVIFKKKGAVTRMRFYRILVAAPFKYNKHQEN